MAASRWIGLGVVLLAAVGCGTEPTPEASANTSDLAVSATSPWSSPEACEAAVRAGRTNPRTKPVFRAATWNVRYFPDGADPKSGYTRPTNVSWLGCTLAWLDADVFVLQEIEANDHAEAALAELVARLDDLTNGRWRVDIDDCDRGPYAQHEAFLHDEARVSMTELRHVAWDEREGEGNACDMGRRSAWTARVSAPSGRVLRLVDAHAKSGEDPTSFAARQAAFTKLGSIVADARGPHSADPVVLAGDFNTMGCGEGCVPKVDAAEEIRRVATSATAAGMSHVRPGLSCSYLDDEQTGLLDHFLVSDALAPLTSPATFVSGLCSELKCSNSGVSKLRAWRELSDHCPVLVNVANP